VDSALGPVDVMESYRLSQRRYLVAINPKGQLTVFKENGTLHGTAQTAGQVLALRPIGNSPVFVMAHGMGYLDMRTMTASDRTCVGLNNSHIVAAAFDVTVASRLHAHKAYGDLLTLALSGDQ
jgi:hypothetical protein